MNPVGPLTLCCVCRCVRLLSSSAQRRGAGLGSGVDITEEGLYTAEHVEMRASLNKLIQKEINPHVEEWERAQMFPAQKVWLWVGPESSVGGASVIRPGTWCGWCGLEAEGLCGRGHCHYDAISAIATSPCFHGGSMHSIQYQHYL